ncbi:ATP-binding protein [Sinorhizobium meliloti]|uniref:ATP-binding protein n=1 Tax=Rhizobium meliloti TaxID=382 RepID=UPI003D64B8FB
MNFLILRVLQHSELGMFHAYRRSGREGSRQRAINFDGDVVGRVFPAATDLDRIPLLLFYDTDDGPQLLDHSLKRQAKNWRLEGNCPTDDLYKFLEPGCLFAMEIEAGRSPATGAWTVFPKDDPTAQIVLADGSTSGLFRAGMIALEREESERIRRLLSTARPDMFTSPIRSSNVMTDASNSPSSDIAPRPNGRRKLPPNAERLADMLGDAGHRLPTAVADIIDNSIEAGATEVDILFDPPNSGHGRWMVIRDNGKGMNAQTLEEAMRIGSDAIYGGRSLGKYGYGLKGASWSQARVVLVVTKEAGRPSMHLGWDKLDMADFSVIEDPLEPWEVEATRISDNGTAVLWKYMKTPLAAPSVKGVSPHVAEIQELTRHLELVFHRFLEGEAKGRPQLTIRVNGIIIEPNGPASHPLSQPFDSKVIRVPLEAGYADVRVQPFLLPTEEELKEYHASDGAAAIRALDRIGYGGRRNETQGLFIYRNDRLIKWGGWHGIWKTNEEKTKLARVVIDFDKLLDEAFQINIAKQEVSLPGYLQERIKSLAEPVRKESFAKYGRKPSPRPAPRAPAQTLPAADASSPSATSPHAPVGAQGRAISSNVPDSTPPSPALPSITIRPVSTNKFAWKISDGFTGGRILQVSSASPALAELARVLESDSEAAAALAVFLEELDQLDVQQALISDSGGA